MTKKERPRLQGSEKRKSRAYVLLHSGIYYFFVRRCRTGTRNDQNYQLHPSTKKSSQLILLLSNSVLLGNFLIKLEKLTSSRIFTKSKGKTLLREKKMNNSFSSLIDLCDLDVSPIHQRDHFAYR